MLSCYIKIFSFKNHIKVKASKYDKNALMFRYCAHIKVIVQCVNHIGFTKLYFRDKDFSN